MQSQKTGPQRPDPVFFRKKDLWILALLLAAALAAWALLRLNAASTGLTALVSVTSEGGDTQTSRLDLGKDGPVHIEAKLPVTLQVEEGAVRFVDSVCPDHDCEAFGWLRREGDWAACLPAGVVVRVEKG